MFVEFAWEATHGLIGAASILAKNDPDNAEYEVQGCRQTVTGLAVKRTGFQA